MMLAGNLHLCAQGFVNLNFESANVPVVPAGQLGTNVLVSQGIPGWTAYEGLMQVSQIGHNDVSLGGPYLSIQGPQWNSAQILVGNYTMLIQGSFGGAPSGSAAIGQSGLVPIATQSLQFISNPGSNFQVTFNNQIIPIIPINSFPNFTLFGGDISLFAGQSGELRFTGLANGGGLLDSIIFSASSIPEPSIYSLLGCGVLLFGAARATFKRRQ